MLIAVTVLGAAIAGIILFSKSGKGNLKAKELRDKAREIFTNTEGQPTRSSLQSMG